MMAYHKPVLLEESINGLDIKPGGIYVDCTFGGGGHAKEILKRLDNGRLIAFDQDKDAILNLPDDDRVLFVNHNFRFITNFLKYHEIESVNGILADLGVSSHHFDTAQRGFSFRLNGPLDMRMNPESRETAADIVNKSPEDVLVKIFSQYGEITNAKKLARIIVSERARKDMKTTADFLELIQPCVPPAGENKYLAKVFQALRIEVNNEIKSLEDLLLQSVKLIRQSGRLVIISYHSLEDRMVKNFIKTGKTEGEQEKDIYGNVLAPFRSVSKLIVPGKTEISDNPRARSAKLRIAEKN